MPSIRTSKAFEQAGREETRLLLGNLREKYVTLFPGSLGAVPETMRRVNKTGSCHNKIASRVGRALKKK